MGVASARSVRLWMVLAIGGLALLAVFLQSGLSRAQSNPSTPVTPGHLEVVVIGGIPNTVIHFEIVDDDGFHETMPAYPNLTGNASVPDGIVRITETVPPGHRFEGWATPVGGKCPINPTTTSATFSVDVKTDGVTRICAYNSPRTVTDGNLRLAAVGGQPGQQFTFALDHPSLGDQSVVVPSGGATVVDVPAGAYTIGMEPAESAALTGWAIVPSGQTCPAHPRELTDTIQMTLTNTTVPAVLCAYVEFVAQPNIRVIAAAGQPDETYPILIVDENEGGEYAQTLDLELDEAVDLVAPEGAALAFEGSATGFLGWAIGSDEGCPADPATTEATLRLPSPAQGSMTVVCAYHDSGPPPAGHVAISTVGDAPGALFSYILDGEEDATVVTTAGGSESAEVPEGPYTVSALAVAGHLFEGWALAADGSCPAAPSILENSFAITVVAGESIDLCAYASVEQEPEPVPGEWSMTIERGWNFIAWLGADGTGVDEALTGLNGDSVLSSVTAIYTWDAGTQTWRAWFPGAPFASDFTTFTYGDAYFVAVSDGPLTWTYALPSTAGASVPAAQSLVSPAGS